MKCVFRSADVILLYIQHGALTVTIFETKRLEVISVLSVKESRRSLNLTQTFPNIIIIIIISVQPITVFKTP